jgi:hypothetical protein
MRKYILTISLVLGISILILASNGKKYGSDISLKEVTKVSEILASPEKYEGQKVLIEGLVVNVCEKRGCWIEVASDKEYESIRVKVNDGEIVFPMEAKGEKVLVEGEVYSFDVEQEAECSGEDKAKCSEEQKKVENGSCCSKEKKTTKVYQIKGLGAVI